MYFCVRSLIEMEQRISLLCSLSLSLYKSSSSLRAINLSLAYYFLLPLFIHRTISLRSPLFIVFLIFIIGLKHERTSKKKKVCCFLRVQFILILTAIVDDFLNGYGAVRIACRRLGSEIYLHQFDAHKFVHFANCCCRCRCCRCCYRLLVMLMILMLLTRC